LGWGEKGKAMRREEVEQKGRGKGGVGGRRSGAREGKGEEGWAVWGIWPLTSLFPGERNGPNCLLHGHIRTRGECKRARGIIIPLMT